MNTIDHGRAWLRHGDIVWATAYEADSTGRGLRLRQRPVKGLAIYPKAYPDASGAPTFRDGGKTFPFDASPDPSKPARYFVPLRKTDGNPSWSKLIEIGSRDLSSTYDEAVDTYDRRVRMYIREHMAAIEEARKDLIRPNPDGT